MVGEIGWTEDPEAHIARHGITPAEVEDAIYSRPRWVAVGRDASRLVFARTAAGRYLFVVLSRPVDGRDFVITARDMTKPGNDDSVRRDARDEHRERTP